jgi:two-component system invasion response regulator UvrY
MIRLLIADDHPVVREGLKRVVEGYPDIAVVGDVADGGAVAPTAATVQADVVLLDVSMPGPGVESVLSALTRDCPRARALVLSVHDESQYAIRLLRAGAAGYLSKDRSGQDLVAAVRRVYQGGLCVSDAVAESMARRLRNGKPEVPHEQLSSREYEVLLRLAAGQAVRTIAADLGISPKTVQTYRTRIRAKLGVENDAELIRYAVEHELLA